MRRHGNRWIIERIVSRICAKPTKKHPHVSFDVDGTPTADVMGHLTEDKDGKV